jgi:DNA polymerase III alpha subunit
VSEQRVEKELVVIRDKGYADYFLVVDEIVRQAPRTCGRGSAAASIVSYCLGITHVDPIKHHLFFERFLNPGRHDPPDIDIDFPWDERPKILEWVFAHYGHQHAAMVANQNTLASRAALREIAKVYGLPAGEIGKALNFLHRRADFVAVQQGMTVQDWARDVCRALNSQDTPGRRFFTGPRNWTGTSGIWDSIPVASCWSPMRSDAMYRLRSPLQISQ